MCEVNMRVEKAQLHPAFYGSVHVYSDFDGTYCPEKHSAMHNPWQNPDMVKYCKKMNSFFKEAGNDIDFTVTTGRTYGEYEAVSWLLKIRDYRLPLPKSVIVKNGSDEFLKTGTDSDFYDKGIFPYNPRITSKEKEDKIKALTNWEGEKIHSFIKSVAKKFYLEFIEGESENSKRDYGSKSLYSQGKLNPDEWTKMPQKDGSFLEHEKPIVDFELASRDDGKLKVNLTFPPDYDFCPFRRYVYDSCVYDITSFLAENNVKYFQTWTEPTSKNHFRKSITITPNIGDKELNKLFDTREAVLKALGNNDLVIVAGDGSNDFQMLNPLEYIDEKDWARYAKGTKCPEFYFGDMKTKLRDLRHLYKGYDSEYINDLRQELTENGLLKRLENMPLIGIVVKSDNSKLQKLVDTFSLTGKIIEIDKGQLDTGIKKAIKNYAQINDKFKNNMNNNLKKMIEDEIC